MELENLITSVLTSYSVDQLKSVLQHLDDLGVEKEEDLQYVKESDLLKVMKPIQARKLVHHWNKSLFSSNCADFLEFEVESPLGYESSASSLPFQIDQDSGEDHDIVSELNTINQKNEEPQRQITHSSIESIDSVNNGLDASVGEHASQINVSGEDDSKVELDSCEEVGVSSSTTKITEIPDYKSKRKIQPKRPWVYDFEIPWNSFSIALLEDCKNGIRPLKRLRRDMVRILINNVMKLTANPRKKYLDVLAYAIVSKYPKSFKDVFDGNVVGSGHSSLTAQLQNRVENVRRCLKNDLKLSESRNDKILAEAMDISRSMEKNGSSELMDCEDLNSKVSWFYNFKIPWNAFSEKLMDDCHHERRPEKRIRTEMIRILVDHIMKRTPKPEKKYIDLIAYSIVSKYPASFQDLVDGEVIGTGHSSFTDQMLYRVDHLWRKKKTFNAELGKRAICTKNEIVDSSSNNMTISANTDNADSSSISESSSTDPCSEGLVNDIPWHEFPKKLMEDCRNGVKPQRKLRLEMVRVLIDYAMKKSFVPGRLYLDMMARSIVTKYPASFKDKCDGEVIGSGHSSLTDQLCNRSENVRRYAKKFHTLPIIQTYEPKDDRKRKITEINTEDVSPLPITESQRIKQELQIEYKKNKKDMVVVRKKMRNTFLAQKKDIENELYISILMKQWPFLFEEEFLLSHFCSLLGKDDTTEFLATLKEKSINIFNFLESSNQMKSQPIAMKIREESRCLGNFTPMYFRSIELLASMLNEKVSAIYRTSQDETDIKSILEDLPTTPILLLHGDSVSSSHSFTVCVERNVIAKPKTFFEGIVYTFACYFVFNIVYPKEAKATLEFIQRYFAKVNECTSNQRKYMRNEVNPKVRRLLSSVSKYS